MSNRNPIIPILALTLGGAASCTGPNPWMPDDTMGSTTDTSDTSVADDVTPHDLPDSPGSTDTTTGDESTSDTTSESTSETTSGETESSSSDTGPDPIGWGLGCCVCIEGQAPVCIMPDDPTSIDECKALAAAAGTLESEKPWTWLPCDVYADGSFDCPFEC